MEEQFISFVHLKIQINDELMYFCGMSCIQISLSSSIPSVVKTGLNLTIDATPRSACTSSWRMENTGFQPVGNKNFLQRSISLNWERHSPAQGLLRRVDLWIHCCDHLLCPLCQSHTVLLLALVVPAAKSNGAGELTWIQSYNPHL